ncbi:hypothetical protein [Mesorhizobium sp. ES1-3]|uniref:hypothetical protein n=1 Tax=Mesorhizobium sp. ES1-3 TaxID=2876628 RepID=UPI001CCF02C7|nr:hypothetical protein [Mesorhizobium sp. ES1-3]MBZ9674083.1 hypothetical protein [Mesorhizobium sp. ES1-3]
MDIADYANEVPAGSRLGSLDNYLRTCDLGAPIDMYRVSISQILTYSTPERLRDNDFIGRLLVIGIVSSAEAYFRAVLSFCIEICPLARSNAARKTVNLGGLLWHGQVGFSRSAFEHASFASKNELVSVTKEYIGFKMEDTVFLALLEQYEVVCQLRHGIVHGDGLLPGKNAVQLDIQRYDGPIRITIGYGELQDIASVVSTLVMTFNREIFVLMCKRWAIDWRQRADWEPRLAYKMFGYIWKTFHSKEDWRLRRGRSHMNRSACLAKVEGQYNL